MPGPFSYVEVTASGSTSVFNVTFPYLDKSHVTVSVNGNEATFSWQSDTQVNITPKPSSGDVVRIQRATPGLDPETVFSSGQLFAGDLNSQTLQLLYLNQETYDALSAEVGNRGAADTTLQSNIDAETSARETAVSGEATARESADGTLQSNLESEASSRETADDAEASAREGADTTLQNNLDAEEIARVGADTEEASTRAEADSALQTALNNQSTLLSAEALVREHADTNLGERVAAVEATSTSGVVDSLGARTFDDVGVATAAPINTDFKAIETNGQAAKGDLGDGRFYYDPDSAASADGYTVIAPDDPAPASGRYLRLWDRDPRPQDFGGRDEAAIERAATYAAAQIGAMEFAGAYTSTRNITLQPGVTYHGQRGAVIDGSGRTDSILNTRAEAILQVAPGSKGSGVALAVDLIPTTGGAVSSIAASSGTATITTAQPHGLSVGDYVWMIYAASGPPDGLLYFLSQAPSTELMARTLPFVVTAVADSTHFSYAVDPAAPSSISATAVYWFSNDRMVKTATAHGRAVGDYIEVSSLAYWADPTGQQPTVYLAERLRVQRVVDATTLIVDAPPKYAYLVADSAVIAPISWAKATHVERLLIVGRGSTGTTTGGDGDNALASDLCERLTADRVVARDCETMSIVAYRSLYAHFSRCGIEANFADDGGRVSGVTKLPYGFVYGGVDTVKYDHCWVRGNLRHGIVESNVDPGYSKVVVIDTPDIRGTISNCIAHHGLNEGYTVRGGYLSGNEWGLDIRTGNVVIEGVRGSGGYGLAVISHGVERVAIKDVRGDNYYRDMILIEPGSGNELDQVVIRGVRARNVRSAVNISAFSGALAATVVDIEDVRTDHTEQGAVSVTFDATAQGTAHVRKVYGTDVGRGSSTKAVVSVTNASGGFVDEIDGSATSGTLVPVATSNAANIVFGANLPSQLVPTYTISGGVLTVTRWDDFTAVVRGEGNVDDNLDAIVGMRPGQRITLKNASETITLRDGSTSGVTAASHAVQTAGGTSIVLNHSTSPYQHVVITALPSGALGVYYPVATVNYQD